ncbi:hypothetical protein C7N43_16595 [Sphingobacteriales bacterium UPWRP_1]|nr:hypothetical protein BVG80_05425 [Sphingobacteriales bacterium TSM_CSM]PSJ75897.1 hypothetical protein C7N43_16595 [Sphingobacteriales bacterium UPWRP_1]
MAQNEPQSPGSNGLNTPADIDGEIAKLEGELKSDYLGANVVAVLGIAMPLLLLGLQYMQAISVGSGVQVLLWVILLVAALMAIGITTNVGKNTAKLGYLKQQKRSTMLKLNTGNPQLQMLVYETLQHLNAFYANIQQRNNRSTLFFSALAVAAMLLAAAAALGLKTNQGIGNYILLGSAVAFALLSVYAYTTHRNETTEVLKQYHAKLENMQELTAYLYLMEQSTDEEEKKLMTQKMIDNFLNLN